jgi:hypothetical protein
VWLLDDVLRLYLPTLLLWLQYRGTSDAPQRREAITAWTTSASMSSNAFVSRQLERLGTQMPTATLLQVELATAGAGSRRTGGHVELVLYQLS